MQWVRRDGRTLWLRANRMAPRVLEMGTGTPTLRVTVNGVLVTDFSEGDAVPAKKEDYEPDRGLRPNSGYIGLQNHDEKGHVYFREVSVAPIE